MPKTDNPYRFTCSSCGGHVIEEIMVKVVVASTLIIHHDGDVDYEDQTNEGGEVERFQCEGCGAVLVEDGVAITDREQMVEWIKSRRD
jgi:hypothetical protein